MRREHFLGAGLILIGLALVIIFWRVEVYASSVVDQFVALGGDCTEGGVCLHQAATSWLVIGLIPSVLVIAAGAYLLIFGHRVPQIQRVREEESFEIMLRALSTDERRVLRVVRDEEGITQSTLKYRTDLSKSKLSQVLGDLEARGLVSRDEHGNTKKVFLRRPDETEQS